MVVGVCKLLLAIPGARSLKAKRSPLRKIIDRTRSKFHLSIAETGCQDKWQRAEIGFSVVGTSHAHVEARLQRITTFIEELYVASIIDAQHDVSTFSGEEY
jgi:uncharacterized protein YlxP (DUF503 family)